MSPCAAIRSYKRGRQAGSGRVRYLTYATHDSAVRCKHHESHHDGIKQIARDARISTLYEGTTGIQALDLLGRKVLLNTKGKCVRDFYTANIQTAEFYFSH